MAKAGQRKRVVACTAYHVFRLPQVSSGNAAPCMQCVQPGKANDVTSRWWWNLPGLVRLSEHKPERRCQGSEFCRGNEGEIDLQSAREEKYAVNPLAGPDIKMMQSEVLLVHVRSPIRKDIRQLGCSADAKSEVYVRPLIFALGCRRASDRSTTDALVFRGIFQEAGAQAITFFRTKHSGVNL